MRKEIGLALLAVCLSGCSAPSGTQPDATRAEPGMAAAYRELGKAGGRVFALDPAASAVRIYAFRAGPAAKLGHNHVLSAPRFTGFFHLPPAGASTARFDLEFRLDELEIDNPAYRLSLGPGFSSPLPQEAIDGTREHMLGADNLEADRFPFVRIRSLQIAGEAPRFAARIEVELHGQKRDMWVPLAVEGLPGSLKVSGSFVLRQTDFGAKPYYVLGGLIAVQDEVVVDFTLVGK